MLPACLGFTRGNRRYYSASHAHPLYPELHNIVLKTSGLKDILAEALPRKKINYAFVFGSVASKGERADSDIDLMIVGMATHRDLASALRAASERIGREINPHFFEPAELTRRLTAKDHFLGNVIGKPKLFIIGDENEFTTWLAAGWLQPHKASSGEIRDLWQIVSRDLTDAASGGISADWQYGIAYNAALKLRTFCSGTRSPSNNRKR